MGKAMRRRNCGIASSPVIHRAHRLANSPLKHSRKEKSKRQAGDQATSQGCKKLPFGPSRVPVHCQQQQGEEHAKKYPHHSPESQATETEAALVGLEWKNLRHAIPPNGS